MFAVHTLCSPPQPHVHLGHLAFGGEVAGTLHGVLLLHGRDRLQLVRGQDDVAAREVLQHAFPRPVKRRERQVCCGQREMARTTCRGGAGRVGRGWRPTRSRAVRLIRLSSPRLHGSRWRSAGCGRSTVGNGSAFRPLSRAKKQNNRTSLNLERCRRKSVAIGVDC